MPEADIQDVICDKLWFEDASVVIAASVERSRHLFKVHKSVLSSHSPVLRDLFTLPQPLAGDRSKDADTYDGLPLVVFPDTPEDVRALLITLYYPAKFACRRNRRSTCKKVAGVLRLSTKYEIVELCKKIKDILEADWPSTFEAWEANEVTTNGEINASAEPFETASKLPHSVEIIKLARECHITGIRRAAFYNIARIQEDYQLDDFVKGDYLKNACCRETEIDDCGSGELVQIIAGREALRRHAWDIYSGSSSWLNGDCFFPKGERRDKCLFKRNEWWTKIAGRFLFIMEDLLGTLRMIIGRVDEDLSNEVCLQCRKRLVERMRMEQQEIWERLPDYFKLEPYLQLAEADPMDSESDDE